MRTPRFLMGAALLFWGWQNGMLPWALGMAAAAEGARYSRARWELSNTDLNRIADLCWALFLGAGLMLYSTEDRMVFIFRFSEWLPFCFFPLLLAQAYGNRPAIPLNVILLPLRRAQARTAARKSYNITYPYFGLCLLAASASTRPNGYFYTGIAVLVALALTSVRPRRVSWAAWIALVLAASIAGQFTHRGLKGLQNEMEGFLGNWLASFLRQSPDPRECRTSIGHNGPIALSGKIALRLRTTPGGLTPSHLREGIWDEYKSQTWWSSTNDFAAVHLSGADSFKLLPAKPLSSEVEISRYYDGGEGQLDLPQGTFQLSDLPAIVRTNALGVTTIDGGPGLVDFKAEFASGGSLDAPPTALDRMVPEGERPALDSVLSSLHMKGLDERKKIRAIENYFGNHFTYSLNVPQPPPHSTTLTPLGYFLTKSHAGHCEYFGTAAVLLLREAGISARYITGYAVTESARHGDTYLIRARHAHAWALVYHQDSKLWEQIDTTPGKWDEITDASPPWWEPMSDTFSNLYFQFSKWRWSKTSFARYTSWLLVPLILYLTLRIIYTQRRQRGSAKSGDAAERPPWPGLDSELFLIDRRLAAANLARLPNESLASWQRRLEAAFPGSDRLRQIFLLHRALRFDPRGLHREDRETLRNHAEQWLSEFAPARTVGKT